MIFAIFIAPLCVNATENLALRGGESIILGNYRISCEGTATTTTPSAPKFYRCTTSGFNTISDSGWQSDLTEAKRIAEQSCLDWYRRLPRSSQQGQIIFCNRPSCESR